MTLPERVDGWFMGPCPAERLAALRIAVGGFGTCYLLVRLFYWFQPLGYRPRSFAPVGVLGWLNAPLSAPLLYALVGATIVSGALFTLGFRTALAGPAYAVLLLLVTSYRNSWGMLFHVENLLVLHTFGLALAPVASAWSLDARGKHQKARFEPIWSMRLLCLLTVITYVIAGVAKLRHAGLEWASGDVLREHVAYDALRKIELGGMASPVGPALVRQAWLFPPLAWMTLAIELGAPLALFVRRWALGWCLGAWSFHVGVLVMMGIAFPYPLLFVAYLPFFPVEEWVASVRKKLGKCLRHASAPHARH